VVGLDGLCSEAAAADYVVNILPDSPETTDLYNETFFRGLRPSALFLNVGRGTAVVDSALLAALREGRLTGAVLNVFREEPLPAEHPFWAAPGLTLTGHIAGPLVPAALARLFVDNLMRFQAGAALNGEVDFTRAY
jgi:phosphoglycerate dehydrogenase-like enzyme